MTQNASVIEQGHALSRAAGLVLVLDTPKGRGIFASTRIPSGTIIDVSPVLIFTPSEASQHIAHTSLNHYTYTWPTPRPSTTNPSSPSSTSIRQTPPPPTQALALGLGSLFNHSTHNQNVGWRRAITRCCLIYTALRDIDVGEELCISYGNGHLWFEDFDAASVGDDPRGIIKGVLRNGHRREDECGDGSVEGKSEFELSGLNEISTGDDKVEDSA